MNQPKHTTTEIRELAENVKCSFNPLAFYQREIGDFKGASLWRGGVNCPFCDGKKDKFRINTEDGGWYCSKCKTGGGDIISFVRQRYGLKFFEAMEKITGGKVIDPDPGLAKKREAEQQAARRLQDQAYAQVARVAARIWQRAKEITRSSQHPYLDRKRVKPHGVRLLGDALIIPLVDADGKLSTIQRIFPDGNKRLLTGGKKSGCFFIIGKMTDPLLIAEGFATAASLHEHTGKCTVMAVDAGNLKAVSLIFRQKYPHAQIIICADNDPPHENPAISEIGQRAANEAALAVNGKVFIPPEPGDWNDYVCDGGRIDG